MKVSIVTISYNQANYLEEAINSIFNQDGVDIEYIIVDPGSKDNSRQIIERYRDKFAQVIFEKDDGPGQGLNNGFSYATGSIYGYINSDDLLLPGTINKVVNYFHANPHVDVVSAHGYVINVNGKVLHKVFSNKISSSKYSLLQFTCGNYVLVQQSTFFRSELFHRIGGFEEAGKVVWDAALIVDFIKANARFGHVNDFWSCFRVYPTSITGSGYFDDDVFKALRLYANLPLQNKFEVKTLKALKWISQPSIFVQRIVDGVVNPKRLV